MRTLSEIIVKKDYTVKQKPRPFLDQNNPVIQKGLRLCFIFLLNFIGFYEWIVSRFYSIVCCQKGEVLLLYGWSISPRKTASEISFLIPNIIV